MHKNKKAQITDVFYVAVALFGFAIFILIAGKIVDRWNTEVQGNTAFDTIGKTATSEVNTRYAGMMDGAFMFIMVGLMILGLIFSSLVRVNPAFIFLFFIVLIVMIFITGAMSNAYQEMASNPEYSTLVVDLPMTDRVMTYLPFVTGIFGILIMMVLYKND